MMGSRKKTHLQLSGKRCCLQPRPARRRKRCYFLSISVMMHQLLPQFFWKLLQDINAAKGQTCELCDYSYCMATFHTSVCYRNQGPNLASQQEEAVELLPARLAWLQALLLTSRLHRRQMQQQPGQAKPTRRRATRRRASGDAAFCWMASGVVHCPCCRTLFLRVCVTVVLLQST